jgi:hypothetical protein
MTKVFCDLLREVGGEGRDAGPHQPAADPCVAADKAAREPAPEEMIFSCGTWFRSSMTRTIPVADQRGADSAGNERLVARGYWVFAAGLADAGAAAVVDNGGERAVFTDGPFVESKEYLAGVGVSKVPDRLPGHLRARLGG